MENSAKPGPRKAKPKAKTKAKAKPRKPGRKPLLTPGLEKRLLDILAKGVPRSIACPAVGITDRTLRIWVERARAGEKRYVEFCDKLDEATANAKVTLVTAIQAKMNRDWRAAAFLLERTDPTTFGQRALIPVEQDEAPEPVEVVVKFDDDGTNSVAITVPQPQATPQIGPSVTEASPSG